MTETTSDYELVIQPRYGFFDLNWKELLEYRELLFYLALREIKIRYKQTLMGASWAILQPFFTMIIFTLIFGRIAQMPSEGIPYPLFSYSGLLLWIYFQTSITSSGNSLVGNGPLLSKVYLPRIFLPTAPCLAHLVDYGVAMSILVVMMVYYQMMPTFTVLLLPVIVFLTLLLAAGMGYWLSSIAVKYRDVGFALPFFISMLMFISPVIYPTTMLGKDLQWLLALNPLTGLINAHRAVLLCHVPVDYVGLAISATITVMIFTSGILYLRRTEKYFADLI
jgi:lipopolysaccharide transport system permease protein